MESQTALAPAQSNFTLGKINSAQFEADLLIVQKTLGDGRQVDSSSASIDDLFKGLSISAQKIIDKLNATLKTELPDGLQSLKPDQVTPDATAERIVSGSVAFFEIFAKQNPNLSSEDLLLKFMSEVRRGVDAGYADAAETLEALGAFEFEGIKEGIETTKSLIEEKLKAFELQKRQELGLDPKVSAENIAVVTNREILQQAGGATLSFFA